LYDSRRTVGAASAGGHTDGCGRGPMAVL